MVQKIENNSEEENADKDIKYIELNVFIKKLGLAATGGQAKMLIRSGTVLLNGTPETRNKKKLFNKDIIEIDGKKHVVKIE